MKTARITFLGSDEFKAELERRASAKGISVGELIRRQFDRKPSEEDRLLSALAEELKRSAAEARTALSDALAEVEQTLRIFEERRKKAA